MTAMIALEINGRALTAGRVSPDGRVHNVEEIAAPARLVWESCLGLIQRVASGAEVLGLGIGAAGPIDMAAGIAAPTDIPDWLSGFDVVSAARSAFPAATIRFAYEGVCLALAEQRYGAIAETLDALAISVSERISAGIVVGGFTAVGHTGNAGNIGHVLVPGHDEPCACGGRGCLEAVAGGVASVRWAKSKGWGGLATSAALAESAESGDPIAAAALRRSGTAVGHAISSAAALLDVGLVVVGGPFATAGSTWWRPLSETVAIHARASFLSGLRLTPSTLGDTPTLAGAGLMALPIPQPA